MKSHGQPFAPVLAPSIAALPLMAARQLPDKKNAAPSAGDGEAEAAMSQLELALWQLLAESIDDATFWRRFSRMLDACVVRLPARSVERVYRHADFLLARAGLPGWTVMQHCIE